MGANRVREREFSVRLNQAIPEAESELASAMAQMRQLLEEKKSALGASVKTDFPYFSVLKNSFSVFLEFTPF